MSDLLKDGQFWLAHDDEMVIARKIADFPNEKEPYVLLDLFVDPEETIIVERGAKFLLEVV